MEQQKKQPMLQIVLPKEYEEAVFARFTQLANMAIDSSIERASIQKRFVQQKELLDLLGIGMSTLDELVSNGLRYVRLGRSKLYDLEEVAEVLEKLKF